MTEYWQSQARKFCEFCKCWTADNKVSISYHENGKKHKEAVQKHISALSKKSAKDFKAKEKMDDEIKKMEKAAMAAYMKDVENNADITSQHINELLGNSTESSTSVKVDAEVARVPALWKEVSSDSGSYFWNTQTNETRWDTPDEYLSLAQQEEMALKQEKKKVLEKHKKEESQKEKKEELRAFHARERMKDVRAKSPPSRPLPPTASSYPREHMKDIRPESPPPKAPSPSPSTGYDFGPAPRAQPYGEWTTVINISTNKVDFQLPSTRERLPPPVVAEPEVIRFKERKVESLGDGPVEFKKRKINNPKRNARQKLDDD